MKFTCQHCDTLTEGVAYRVTSEEAGVILLDMIVCYSCFEQAKSLGLNAEEVDKPAPQSGACGHLKHRR
jgi:RNase P subunit RPR2